MRLFGFEIARVKAQTLSAVPASGGGGVFGFIRESFGGAWQQDVTIDSARGVLAFSAVFACTTLIASDVAKLGSPDLVVDDDTGISSKVKGNSPFTPVLQRPNRYQTWFKFVEQWIISKLIFGNVYVLKERDQRGIVIAMYVLNAQRVTPLVAENGDVYYRLARDDLSGLTDAVTVPAEEIIHDMMVSLWHPLVGISPIYACGLSATMGNRIQANSTRFFQNMSRPGGTLTGPNKISDELANRLKTEWETNYGAGNVGRTAVLGEGLEYKAMAIPAEQAQLIEQLKWTVEDVARCYHVPLWKLGGPEPLRTSVESLNQTYYSDCLQSHIESIEALLNYGLSLPKGYCVEFNLDGLLRMDTAARYAAKGQAVKDSIMTPNEARATEDLPPLPGGDTVYMQQQQYSLAALAKRDAKEDPFATAAKPAPAASLPAPAAANDAHMAAELADLFVKGLEGERVDA